MRAPDGPTEAALVQAAQAGDVGAFEALVAGCQARAWRVALRMLGNPSDAQDAVQEAFLAAWRSMLRFQEGHAFGAWMVAIVTHRCLNVLRSRRRARIDDVDPSALAEPPDPSSDPQLACERSDDADRLAAAMQRLAPGALAIIVLHYTDGLTCARIGEILGMGESAVKVALFRARARLRRFMEEQGGGGRGAL